MPLHLMLLLVLVARRIAHAPQVTLPAAAAGHTAELECGKSTIQVSSALFEPTDPSVVCTPLQGKPLPDKEVGPIVATSCNGKSSCNFPVCPFAGFGVGGPGNDGVACAAAAAPPVVGDPCPNKPKKFVVEYLCTRAGWTFVAIVVVGVGLYIGGGMLYASQVVGKPVALDSHPHHLRWLELRSLTLDGFAYARGCARGTTEKYQPICGDVADSSIGKNREQPNRQSSSDSKSKGGKRPSSKSQKRSSNGAAREASHRSKSQMDGRETKVGPGAATVGSGAPTTSISFAAGGGGRWVHVS